MAYISFSLRVARAKGKSEEHWGLNKFERFLNIGLEGIIWFACYLPQMKYLDEHYAIEKMNLFSEKESNNFEWRMFMEGYLEGAQFDQEVYYLCAETTLRH